MRFLLAVAFGLFSVVASAQVPAYFFRNSIPVHENGNPLQHAWAGGLNAPQFSRIDLNLDGTEDLFIFDRLHHRISTFLAVQENGNWKWQFAPEYAAAFPDLPIMYNWALLRDYDHDGRKDLYTFISGGGKLYRNVSTPQTGLQWQLVVPQLNTPQMNINILSSDIPAIEDLDNDGDLDILLVAGAKVSYFRNLSAENTGTPGAGPYERVTDQWGGIRECGCASFLFGAGTNCRVAPHTQNGALLHGGNSLLAIDLDNDLDKDLLWGDFSCGILVKLENQGSPTAALMTTFDATYPLNTQPVDDLLFAAAYYEDLNFDGVKDLAVATNTSNGLNDTVVNFTESVWLYQNTGSNQNPEFSFQQKDYLQDQMIDRGEGAMPAFADADGDGDLDMFVGNYYGRTAQGARATLALYTNTGTLTEPAFELTETDYLNLSAQKILDIRPGFADINGDGTSDLYLSSTEFTTPGVPFKGRVRYFLNAAPAGQPLSFGPMQILDTLVAGATNDHPVFFDIDNDNITDLLVANSSGSVQYFRNTGSNTAPNYQLVTNTYGGLDIHFYRRKPSLAIADADADGNPDLIAVDDSSAVRIYSNFRAQTAPFTADLKFVYDSATNTRITPHLGRRLHVAAADLDGDTYPEIVVGSQAGGLLMLSRTSTINALPPVAEKWPVQVFPNPAQNRVRVTSTEPISVTVLDVLGRQTGQEPTLPYATQHNLDISGLTPGVYLLRLQTAQGNVQVKRLVVAR